MTSPNLVQFLQASDIAYGESISGGVETYTDPLLATQLILLTDATRFARLEGRPSWHAIAVQYIPQDGFYSVAFKTYDNNIIIAYEGTVLGTSQFERQTLAADNRIDNLQIPQALTDAVSFARQVTRIAQSRGVPSTNIYATGHSLGGIEAEYAALNLHLDEVSFGATGIPGHHIDGTSPSIYDQNPDDDFTAVNYVDYGDPIGNYASNMFLGTGDPEYSPTQDMAHVGYVSMVGNFSDAIRLDHSSLNHFTILFGLPYLGNHFLHQYASDLGYQLPNLKLALSESSATDILTSMEAELGDLGLQDLATGRAPSDDVAASDDFRVKNKAESHVIRITQKADILFNGATSDAGVNVVMFDASSGAVASERFTDAHDGYTYQLFPNSNDTDHKSNIWFKYSQSDTVILQNPENFQGTVTNFQVDDTLDLFDFSYFETNIRLSAGNILNFGIDQISVHSPDGFTGDTFTFSPDHHGGTNVNINLLRNGDFLETNSIHDAPAEWTYVGSTPKTDGFGLYEELFYDDFPNHSGRYYSYVLAGRYDGGIGDGIEQTVTTITGASYLLEFGISRGEASDTSTVTVMTGDTLSTFIIPGSSNTDFSPLSAKSINFVATSDVSVISFVETSGINGGGSPLVADISLVKISH